MTHFPPQEGVTLPRAAAELSLAAHTVKDRAGVLSGVPCRTVIARGSNLAVSLRGGQAGALRCPWSVSVPFRAFLDVKCFDNSLLGRAA